MILMPQQSVAFATRVVGATSSTSEHEHGSLNTDQCLFMASDESC